MHHRHSYTPINVQRSLSGSISASSFSLLRISPTFYKRIYNLLRAQHTIISSLQRSLLDTKVPLDSPDEAAVKSFSKAVNNVLTADYADLLQVSFSSVQDIKMALSKTLSPHIDKVGYSILSAILSISRLMDIILYTCSPVNNEEEGGQQMAAKMRRPSDASVKDLTKSIHIPHMKTEAESHGRRRLQKNTNTSSFPSVLTEPEYIICRICDKKVPLCLIETHSKNCALVYETSKNMVSADERMQKLQALAKQTILRRPWPGDEQFTTAVILPILHAVILLDRAICIDIHKLSASDELDVIADAMMSITLNVFYPEGADIIDKANTLLSEKLNATDDLTIALDVVKRTSLAPNDDSILMMGNTTTIADFKFIKRISSGAFARVYLGKKNTTGDIYAIKVIPKTGLRQKNEVQRVNIEKDILMKTYSPYMIKFFYSFIGEYNLYLVMEYLPGGDLYSVLQANGSIDEDSALVYTVQIVLALQFLRENRIIHRDLKPDNILVDSEGHLKLIDFGLSYFGMVDRSLSSGSSLMTVTDSCIGTPDYTSPEIVLSQPHTFAADYFSLGSILYEFLVGVPPFHGQTPSETFQKVVKGHYDTEALEDFSEEVQDLISKLLCSDPTKRIGASSIEEIKQHPWFADVDWNHIENLPKPFVPQLSGKEDTSYFEDRTFSLGQQTDEKDIIDDIQLCRKVEEKERRSSILSIIVDDESPANDSLIEDEMKNFQSVSIHQLQETTKEEARMRRKISKFDENAECQCIPEFKTEKKTRTRRRLPRKSYMPVKNNGISSPTRNHENHYIDDSCDEEFDD
ncbi:AGC family protein kinase [Tritrichomonas foetus]|uniref:non-specific serine/threonine protein kinase n=1 Tax=Tritrichomonas foetus TaxID=1144522 RepID=A0A1J4JLX6_9EUKA|nr:AGC family protein kinase [Tritrichomonas foetus]|eukprot:OHS98533.1 AGC family protein kinase [Tritrichomonas foetus]